MSDPFAEFDDVHPATVAWTRLQSLGVEATSGFRTDEDVKRLKRQGYTAATNGAHNLGDGIDLVPGNSGLSLGQLQARAQRELGKAGRAEIHNGTHVHINAPGWGGAPDVYRDDPWGAFKDLDPAKPTGRQSKAQAPAALSDLRLSGEVHDGDTVGLKAGGNARLFGVDAFELGQQGREADGSLVSLGSLGRDYMAGRVTPDLPINPTGKSTYGRPVVTLGEPGADPAQQLLREGYGLAAPEYLKGSPQFSPYIEAERQARMNFLGSHGTNAETPKQFRRKTGPWQGGEPGQWGEGQAVFWDEPSPTGIRPEIAAQYREMALKAQSPEELIAAAQSLGFDVPRERAEEWLTQRDEAQGNVAPGVDVIGETPRPMIDPGDGTFGAFARGVGDPFNMIDEMGGVADAVGLTGGRENVWNSDRRFGDILWNNIDQNRDVLANDDQAHPIARIGGQLTSGVLLPGFAAKGATLGQFARIGAIEGGLAGFGAGEGNPLERIPNTALGVAAGTAGGMALHQVGEHVLSPAASFVMGKLRRGEPADPNVMREVADEIGLVANDGVQNAGPTPAARSQPQGGVAAMADESASPELVGPLERQRDYIDLGNDPYSEFADAPFGVARPMDERLSAEEMAKLAEGVDPASVLPRPASAVDTLEEAEKANPGRFVELEAPNEFDALGVRQIGNGTRVRGPLDITQRLRSWGGIKDDGGELAHMGIDNAPRRMDFGSNEQFLGRLVRDDGMSLDDAAMRLWEDGYFPEFRERPTPDDLLDRLRTESTGAQRFFRPDDLDEIEDFHGAAVERARIEQARDAGSPLVEERGHTVNLDDLEANRPPISAYEDTPRLTGHIGNVNLDRLEKPEQVSQLIDQISKRVGGFDAANRGKVTHEETRLLAQEIGLRPEQLLKRRQGQALNAEQLYAARSLVQASREAVFRLAKKALGGTDDDVATFRGAWLKQVAIEEQLSGAAAEAGRALSQFNMLARSKDAGANAVRSYLKAAGGRDDIEDAAQHIIDLMEDPAKAGHFMRQAVKPRWRDKFNELWINSLLSGPRTHIVNMVGNSLTTALSFPELAATAAIGKVTRSADRALFGEVGARAAGLADSSIEALRNMRTAFKTGEAVDDTSKIDAVHQKAIPGKLGHVLRTPTRALTAADEFWKTLLSSAEMRQIAYRRAKAETDSPESFKDRLEALLRAPDEAMLKQAQASARYFTFQKPLGTAGRGVQQVSNEWVGGKLVLPFVRTPINILKFAGERSVLGLAMPEVRAALKAGGRARDEALGRITLGSGLSTAAVVAAMDGKISGGGPADPRERAALMQSGWQPYSLKIGDQWVSYQRFDPVSTLVGVAADFAEAGRWATTKEADAIALSLAQGIAKNITNKTWLSGLSDTFEVLTDPDRYGKAYVQRLAGSMAVPSISNQTAQALDPHMRDARTVMDAIKARVPVVSESVPVRRDIWGEPIERGNAVGPDIVSPFYATRERRDPVRKEVARLRVPLSMPKRSMTIDGRKVDLTPEQFDTLQRVTGSVSKLAVEQLMKSPEYTAMPDGERVEAIGEALKDMRAAGRAALIGLHPEMGGAKPQPANDDWDEFKDAR